MGDCVDPVADLKPSFYDSDPDPIDAARPLPGARLQEGLDLGHQPMSILRYHRSRRTGIAEAGRHRNFGPDEPGEIDFDWRKVRETDGGACTSHRAATRHEEYGNRRACEQGETPSLHSLSIGVLAGLRR